MATLRERNNVASKKSYEKAVERASATDYEYEVVRQHRLLPDTRVWHWSNVPEDCLYDAGYIHDYSKHRMLRLLRKKEQVDGQNRLRDYGLDALAKTVLPSGEVVYSGIQAKYYQSRAVTASDIGSFLLKQMTMTHHNPKSQGYLYTTSKLQADVAYDVAQPGYMIQHVLHPWKHTDHRSCHAQPKQKAVNECDLPLRDYQITALEKLKGGGIKALSIPCRMGKTLIAGHALRHHQPTLIVAMAPLKISVENLQERLACFLPGYASILVDSDAGGTTDEKEVAAFMENEKRPIIVYTTFESAVNVLSNIKLDVSDAYILADEVHNATEAACSFINTFPAGIVMSATFPEEVYERLDVADMVSVPFSKGIEGGYIVDYALWLPHLTKNEDGTTSVEADIPIDFQHYEASMVMKALYHAVCVLKTGSRKTIVYLPSQADCDRYMEISRDVFENYHGLTVWTGKITAEVSKERRKAILNEFQQDNTNAIHILTSVRILDEAVDIPACDSVFITTIGETTSDIRFFQRAQRGSTLDPKNPNKRNNIFLWADGWEKCVGALDFLRQADPEYHRKVHVAGVNYADHEGREHERKERMLKEATAFGQWSQMACVSLEERLVRKANALVRWVDKENRVPKKKEVDGLNIGKFWNRVKEGHCKTVYDSILSQNELLRADYDRMVKEREEKVGKTVLSPEEKARTLVRWVDEKKRMPKITEEVDGWNIGHFWNAVKQGKSKSVYESILSQNKLLRTNYEKTMKRREAKIGKPVLSPEEKANALVSWVDEKKRVPKTHEVDSWNIGFFWTNVKQGHCKSVYESILTQNELLRADYDKTMKEREAKVGKTILSPEEKARTLVRWVDKENRVPKRTKDVDGWNISQFWTNVKHGQCKSVYDSILSKNDVLRVDYEKTMKKREAKIGTVLSPEEKANAMVRWVDKENRVPKQSDKVDGTNIGHFWNKVKQGKSQSVYESILSQNELLRTDYEKTMKKREVKMAHTTNSVP